MSFFPGKIGFFLFFVFLGFSLLAKEDKKKLSPPSYWEFVNTGLYSSLSLEDDSYHLEHFSIRSGLSYVMPFRGFAVSVDLFLTLGPYTSSEAQKLSLDFSGFGGGVGFSKDFSFIPHLQNFSLETHFYIFDITSVSYDTKVFEERLNNTLEFPGEKASYRLKIRTYSLDFLLSYTFPRLFSKTLEKDLETSSYGHKVSFGVLVPVYSKFKRRYLEPIPPDDYRTIADSGKVLGFQLVLSYGISFL